MRLVRTAAVLAAAALAASGALAAPAAPAAPPATLAAFSNPIKDVKGADPWIEYYQGNYYMISTSWTSVLTMRRSPTLAGLDNAPSVQVWAGDAASRCCNMWAPELHLLDGPNGLRWYLYYTAGQNVSDYVPTQRLHVLESVGTDPMGPYVYRNQLGSSWQLDASVLRLDGQLYLLGTYHDGTQNLFIQPLANPYTLGGARRQLSTPTFAWERQGAPVQEGPVALQHDGQTFIVYSASFCATPDYKLGLLTYTGGDPLDAGSWAKAPQPVFQRSDANGVYGPGHNGFFSSPDGTEHWIVYHANDSAGGGCDNLRTSRAQPFTWNPDGTPQFGTPVSLGTSLPGPSGETGATPASYTFVNRATGKCLDLADGSTADGANVRLWTCNGAAAQRWQVTDLGDDTNRLVNVAGGKALDLANCDSADGTDIRQWSWLDNPCQRWRLITTDPGWVRLQNQASGKVADVASCNPADGTDVRQWSWLDNGCQQWQIVAA